MRRGARNQYRFEHFPRLQGGLAIRDEKFVDRQRSLARQRGEHDSRVHRQQQRRAVPNRRGRDEIAPHAGAIANLARAEHPQHIAERRELRRHRLFNCRQGRRAADLPFLAGRRDLAQFGDRFERNKRRKSFVALGDVQAQFSRPCDEPGIGQPPHQLQ